MACLGLGKVDQALRSQAVEIARERLELGHHSQDVGMAHRPPDLERAAWTVNLPHGGVSGGERTDRLAPRTKPRAEGNRSGVGHTANCTRLDPTSPPSRRTAGRFWTGVA